MIIDAHQHFWDLSRGDYPWLTPETGALYRNFLPKDLIGTLRENEVTATVLVQAAPSEKETRYLLQLADTHAFVAGVVGWVDFESPDAPQRIAAMAQLNGSHLRGLRPMIQDIPDPQWITRRALDDAFEAMIAHELVFDALVRPLHLAALRTRLLRHPRLRAVLDHAGKPNIADGEFSAWAAALERLARDTAICCKLSGLLTEAGGKNSFEELAPYVAHIFTCFGPERVLWGSDWPVLTASGSYVQWLDLSVRLTGKFAAGQVDAVMAGTAQRLYQLVPVSTGRAR